MLLGTSTILIIGIAFILAIGLILVGVVRSVNRNILYDRIHTYTAVPEAVTIGTRSGRRTPLAALRLRMNATLSSLNSEKIALQLMQANWQISVTEFILIRVALTIACFLLGWLISGNAISGIGLGGIAYLVPAILLRRKINRRQIEFEKQLLDVLILINGAVRAGFSLLQATELVVREMKAPASEEFGRVVIEVSLGVSLPQALRNLAGRMQNNDLNLVVTAVDIHHSIGGNLARMLAAVSETIRERVQLFGEVRVITTQQRYTGYLLSVLPFFIGGMLFIANPEYMMRLFEPGAMLCIPLGALAGIIAGHFAIQRIAKIEI